MDRFIEIKLQKYKIFLTEPEIMSLLAKDEKLWTEALKRGKAFTRARSAAGRNVKISPEKRGIQ